MPKLELFTFSFPLVDTVSCLCCSDVLGILNGPVHPALLRTTLPPSCRWSRKAVKFTPVISRGARLVVQLLQTLHDHLRVALSLQRLASVTLTIATCMLPTTPLLTRLPRLIVIGIHEHEKSLVLCNWRSCTANSGIVLSSPWFPLHDQPISNVGFWTSTSNSRLSLSSLFRTLDNFVVYHFRHESRVDPAVCLLETQLAQDCRDLLLVEQCCPWLSARVNS